MVVYIHNFIGGRRMEPLGSEACEVRSPFNGKWVGVAPLASLADVDLAIATARQAIDREARSGQSLSQRTEVVERFLSTYLKRLPSLSGLITRENATPLWGNVLLGDELTARAASHVEAARSNLSRCGTGTAEMALIAKPAGLVAAMPAWHAPQNMAIGWLIPAILAGCAIILALNPITALDGQTIGELMMEAGLPEGLLSILVTSEETAGYLAGHPGVDRVAVSSSDPTGRYLASIAASRSKSLTLDIGRRSAAIILPDVDIASAVEGLRDNSLLANGQWPGRQDRFLVPRHRQGELTKALNEALARLRLGDPLALSTDIGPLISRQQRNAVMRAIEHAIAAGAELASGGEPVDPGDASGAFFQPTVVANTPRQMNITLETIPGPVILVIPYDEIDQAIGISNEGGYGATAAVWTSDSALARVIAGRLRARVVSINGPNAEGHAPSSQHRRGMGHMDGLRGVDEFVEWQALVT
ncbi:aldehyde dehydrogenase family protein [Ancylobacter pratisalsi]|uniref:Aldehyde dehydrogenase family protein n=1 Tax=Ancylobacter pratisalsi TaxID=1745854 RepID=A0A6P1YNQ6_9HYPH|nr:aldehyde dehydrogenase family protein [Ancylobacter pratisalsi]QIB34530.1 aldehyde dehydrogenase family protein [Ancylobacter pratisalsi]